jgi:hypothetical protein
MFIIAVMNTHRSRYGRVGIAALVSVGVLVSAASAAVAAPRVDGGDSEESHLLNPYVYGGELTVAVQNGFVDVFAEPGQARAVIEAVREQPVLDRPGASCVKQWRNAVAGPGTWYTSANGCAVAGYAGYQQRYTVSNGSDFDVCAQGKGWNGGAPLWKGFGCVSAPGTGGGLVAWGNVLGYMQMKAISLGSPFPGGYMWRA